MNTARTSSEVRKTKETDIQLDLNIDGSGVYEVDTGIGFFDHMLEGFSRHGFFDLKLQVKRGPSCRFPSYDRRYRNCPWNGDQECLRQKRRHPPLRKLYPANG